MKTGFSLVELSIVLVILGLLTGGVMAGQSLIRASELRSVSTDYQKLNTAIFSFRDKYFSVPGDFNKATDFWGAADGNDGLASDCGDVVSTSTATCNGDGNRIIAVNNSTNGVWEKFHFWKHLANAGLLEGHYTGAPETGDIATIGQHFVMARVNNSGFEAGYMANFYRASGNMIKLASQSVSGATGLNGPTLLAIEAWNVDSKLDDGLSDSGKLMALNRSVTGCVTNGSLYSVTTTGSYMLDNATRACALYYFPGF